MVRVTNTKGDMAVPTASVPVNPAAGAPLYMLQWHEHHTSFFRLMEELCREQSLTDVSITCGDVSLEAHSLILGASSPILRSILARGDGKKQTLHFMDMNPYHMQLLLQYMYRGEISVPQAELAPLMNSARALQIKGLCSATTTTAAAAAAAASAPPQVSNGEDKLSEFANYLAQHQMKQETGLQQQQQQQQPVQMMPHHSPYLVPDATMVAPPPPPQGMTQVAPKMEMPNECQTVLAGMEPPQQLIMGPATKKRRNAKAAMPAPDQTAEGAGNAKRKRKSKKKAVAEEKANIDALLRGKDDAVPPDSSNGAGNHVEVGVVLDDELSGSEGGSGSNAANDPLTAGNVSENWSDQLTMKVKGHRIPVLPKPLSLMKTTETRSYLSRLIWATNGWKRPQYGNPDTKPVWWPNELLNWAEMKKMGGKKADGLSNVNYNEIQKTILNEGYKYFGFDPETLCHINKEDPDSKPEDAKVTPQGLTSTVTTGPATTTGGSTSTDLNNKSAIIQ